MARLYRVLLLRLFLRGSGAGCALSFALVLVTPQTAAAQVVASSARLLTVAQEAFDDQLKAELACVCGTCARLPLTQCTCSVADQMRDQLTTQVALGKDRDAVYQYFIDTYGSQEPLATPIGAFNQLAWALPLLAGVLLLVGVILVTRRMSRHRPVTPKATPVNPEAEARLDDELRQLD